MIDPTTKEAFQSTVRDYYHDHGRHDLPWRVAEPDGGFDPYKIMVSELMLQQTQVARVIPKYHEFLRRFPTVFSLAEAPLGEVLRVWNGLGYNRRAKFLWQSAQQIVSDHKGTFPQTTPELVKLPGVGANTASAILAYAFNQPAAFIETNIRTVYIHHFFEDKTTISDKEVAEIALQTLDRERPREWYWALMDYGSFLKQTVGNTAQRSSSYAKQSKFQGSRRQIRGQILRLLGDKSYARNAIRSRVPDERTDMVVHELLAEGLIHQTGDRLSL
ncbi:MAG: hypothetical protein WA843_04890 [Candidatus Saccharimonadales bacterium]